MPLPTDATGFKFGYPIIKWIVCSEFAEERVSKTVRRSFRKPFNMDPSRRESIYAQCKTQEQKYCICKVKVVFCLLRLIQLWTCSGSLPQQPAKINGPGWFPVKSCAKCNLHSCYSSVISRFRTKRYAAFVFCNIPEV
jgi:hypothetical protein